MIEAIIKWSIKQRFLVLLATSFIVIGGVVAVKNTPVDAIPDLSDVQVIIKTSYPGQSPQVVEDQVTYPLTTAMLSVPGAQTVRGFSFFGDSYIYVIFNENTDVYWARSRVLEYLNQAAAQLPEGVKPELGPDASGVGWVYIYALTDPSQQHDLSELRSLQDWFLSFELQTVEGVAEVATLGGMVKQYQVEVDPNTIRALNIPLNHVALAIQRGNQEVGASVVEMAEAEYMINATGYIKNRQDLEQIPIGLNDQGVPILLQDIATIKLGPQMRRGLAELNGEGEVVGGIVVMRSGENAQSVIQRVQEKLHSLQKSLPEGVEVITVYDRSQLIERAVNNLWEKLLEEFVVVIGVCVIFLFHVRSSLVAIISLPVGILTAFIVMHFQGLNANIMSLGGIAIAIGAMVDGAIVMIENMHKHMEQTELNEQNRWQVVAKSATEVGPALFFSLLIITVSFFPVFSLEAQEGRLFAPLAFTKTYAMAGAAALAVTLVPVLMGYFVRGKIRAEHQNPLNRWLTAVYQPVLKMGLRWPRTALLLAAVLLLISYWPASKIGTEFMPQLDEGDLMYMPTTYPGIAIGEARELLQHTDKLIKTVPEVEQVFGKIGRADTATDPAPLTMIETFIRLKPKSEWRAGMTTDDLIRELDALVNIPGLTNAWVMPIKTRIDMLATGIKTPVGIKIAGPDLTVIQDIGQDIELLLADLQGTASVYAERVSGGRYLKLDVDRLAAARYGLNVADIQQHIALAVGGKTIAHSVEKLERYPINIRFPQQHRANPEAMMGMPLITPSGAHIALGEVVKISIEDGPPGIKSENARINGWVYVDIENIDVGHYVAQARELLDNRLELPPGYAINWSGQYEYMLRAQAKLMYLIPITLLIIALLLFFNFKRLMEVAIIMGTLPFALVGSVWLIYALGFNYSVSVGVGFIALAGVAVEVGVIMLNFLNRSMADMHQRLSNHAEPISEQHLQQAVLAGSVMRVRPVMMTSLSIIVGLMPIMLGDGTGSEVMSRIAAPMVGGMFSALLLTLIILPVIYYLIHRPRQAPSTSQ
ncbi:efflux RND transporter permease subunit [Marinicella meishanensis]|uniref:efflux RND transporter permease subunit n=1 Tax=Marinicella meishanensis TaxID=2873263 RepID=UPI001CC0A14F|nr:CusA/CzcA family heavy metal efflux RND transporter [Marinicella sp. NBU2979]